jgi:hypothetical protein
MAEFYEIHDSKLKKIAWNGDQAQVTLSAVIIVADDEKMLRSGWQLIQLNLNQAIMTGDPVNSEVWLYEGTFVTETEDSRPEDRGNGCIAASLKHAIGVHLHLSGHAEDRNEYPTFDIRGQSMTLETLSPVEWENT